MRESSHRAETPRPAERWRTAGLGTAAAAGGTVVAAVSESQSLVGTPTIAPCREESQAAPLPKLVSTQTANGGGEGQPLAA